MLEVTDRARLAVKVGGQQLQEARALLSTLQHEQQQVTALVARQLCVVNNLERAQGASQEVHAEVGRVGALPGLAEIVADHEEAAGLAGVEPATAAEESHDA